MRILYCCVLLAICIVPGMAVHADDPRVAPSDHKEFSPNHKFFLVSKVKEKRTEVFRSGKPGIPLWNVPSYLEIADLSDDGRFLAASYPGGNILEPGVQTSDALVTFYNADGRSRVITVGEMLPGLAAMQHSSSGIPWGRVIGFQPNGQLLIILNNGRHITLDPAAGRPERVR